MFGAPDSELHRMKRCIVPGSHLFLLNFQTVKLMGPFVADCIPEHAIVPGAFGGKYNAHVRVVVKDTPLHEVKLGSRIPGGQKSAEEVAALEAQLKQGNAVEAKVQQAWGVANDVQEPVAKKPRLQSESCDGLDSSRAGSVAPKPNLIAPKNNIVPKVKPNLPSPSAATLGNQRAVLPKAKAESSSTSAGEAAQKNNTDGNKEQGYVFLCSNSTMQECQTLKVLASPDSELSQMKRCIKPGTKIFLLNFQSLKLIGPFVAVGNPDRAIVPGAFGGRYNAHVRVAVSDEPLFEVKLERRMAGGPKPLAEVMAIQEQLRQGGAAPASVQEAWRATHEDTSATAETEAKVVSMGSHMLKLELGAKVIRDMSLDARKALQEDLRLLGEDNSMRIQLLCPKNTDMDSVTLFAKQGTVCTEPEQLQELLQFYGIGGSNGQAAANPEGSEVHDLTVDEGGGTEACEDPYGVCEDPYGSEGGDQNDTIEQM